MSFPPVWRSPRLSLRTVRRRTAIHQTKLSPACQPRFPAAGGRLCSSLEERERMVSNPEAPQSSGRIASLTLRLALSVALVLLAGGTAVALAAFAYGRQAAQQAYDRLLIGAADQIAGSVIVRGGTVSVDIPASL
jgi:hypothetical protein